MKFEFQTKPLQHQLKEFNLSKNDIYKAIYWEQGTGKTKLTIDTFQHLYLEGKVNSLLVLAPNGVHRNWVVEELPIHLPERLLNKAAVHYYQSSKAKTITHQRKCKEILKHNGLCILCMSYDGIMTKTGRSLAKKFLTTKEVFYVLDESQKIKNPAAKRTKRVLASGIHCKYKRILSGTPVSNGPFNVFSQMSFLNPLFWKEYGLLSYHAFKTTFGVFKSITTENGKMFDVAVGYRNLKYLNSLIEPYSSRVLKSEVLDLPDKIYKKRYFELSVKQKKLYNDLKENYFTELENGTTIYGNLAIVRLLRFQQITSGYLPKDEDDNTKGLELIDEKNPRLETLKDLLEDNYEKTIIFAKYKKDIELIMEFLGTDKAVRYDGSVDDDDRAAALKAFQKGDKVQYFVANDVCAGEGLTLHAAKWVIYYNTTYRLDSRLQSEDRAHRIGQKDNVVYTDLIAVDTIDEKIISSLRNKISISSKILGDKLKEWI